MNVAEYRRRVAGRLGVKIPADSSDIDQNFLSYLNEAYVQVLVETRCAARSADLTTTVDKAEYELPAEVLALYDIGGTENTIYPVATTDMLRSQQSPVATDLWGLTTYTLVGANLLILHPTPAATGTLTFWYTPAPGTLALADDVPVLVPFEHHNVLESYVLWKMADYDDDATSAQGRGYQQDYEQGLMKMRHAIRKKRGVRGPGLKVRAHRRRAYHFNDMDYRW